MTASHPVLQVEPRVSIVVPVYQAEKFVAATIESLLAQTYKNLEIIAFDDGSTDGSLHILKSFADERMQVHSRSNKGQAATLNEGWSMATGEIFGYLSADDLLRPTAIELLVKALLAQSQKICGIYPDYDLIGESGAFIKSVAAPEFSYSDLLVYGVCAPGPGALFTKDSYQRTNGWNIHLKQVPDFDFWLRLTSEKPLAKLSANLACFRVHETSASYRAPDATRADEPNQTLDSFWQEITQDISAQKALQKNLQIDDSALLKLKKTSRCAGHLLSARLHLRGKRWARFIDHSKAALKYDPWFFFSWQNLRWQLNSLRYLLQSSGVF